MDYATAKNIVMGITTADDATIHEAMLIIMAEEQADNAALAAKLPPMQPPYGPAPTWANSHSGANNLQAGVFIQDLYLMMLNYDSYIYDINEANINSYAGATPLAYAPRYRSWRQRWDSWQGKIPQPPTPLPYQKPMTMMQFATWWASNKQTAIDTEGGSHPPHFMMLAPKISDFDFDAAIAAKQAQIDAGQAAPSMMGNLRTAGAVSAQQNLAPTPAPAAVSDEPVAVST